MFELEFDKWRRGVSMWMWEALEYSLLKLICHLRACLPCLIIQKGTLGRWGDTQRGDKHCSVWLYSGLVNDQKAQKLGFNGK